MKTSINNIFFFIAVWILTSFFVVECRASTFPVGFQETTVVSGLNISIGIEFLPDGRMLVIEQTGNIRLVVNNVLQTTPVLDISTDILYSGEQGLLGIAVDPDYPSRPYIYLFYTNLSPNFHYVVRYTLTGTLNDSLSTDLIADTSSRMYLLNDIPNDQRSHNSGTLRFGPDKTLFISIGDDQLNGGDTCEAQNPASFKGVILRILVDDSVIFDPVTKVAQKSSLAPSDNPWVSSPDENERLVWAYGLRNPFRFNTDSLTGRLFIADVGWQLREEIDMSLGGENFGWPYWEGTLLGPDQGCGGEDGTMPIYEVQNDPAKSHVCGPAYRITGNSATLRFPVKYEGLVFFTDFYEGFLRALNEKENGTWDLVSPSNLPNDDFGYGLTNPSDLITGPDGALYYTDLLNGEVKKIGFYPDLTLVGTYPFNDNANDESGNGNDGTIYGAIFTTGINGTGLQFDGDDYVDIGNIDFVEDFTISAWIKITNPGKLMIVGKTFQTYQFFVSPAGNIMFQRNSTTPINYPAGLVPDTWYHVAVTFDTTNGMSLYLNGNLVSTNGDVSLTNENNADTKIGATGFTPKHFFSGIIDEVRIYSSALTNQEIQNLYGAFHDNDLLSYYAFEGGSGPIAIDSSGNGNDGAINGGSAWAIGENGNGGGLEFNGFDAYVDIGDIDLTDAFTIAAWIKITNQGKLMIVGKTYQTYQFFVSSAGNLMFQRNSATPINYPAGLVPDTWYHVAVTFDTTNGMALYFNGSLVSTNGDISVTNENNIITKIGATGFIPKHFFSGTIDEVHIYRRALTDLEVQDLYNN